MQIVRVEEMIERADSVADVTVLSAALDRARCSEECEHSKRRSQTMTGAVTPHGRSVAKLPNARYIVSVRSGNYMLGAVAAVVAISVSACSLRQRGATVPLDRRHCPDGMALVSDGTSPGPAKRGPPAAAFCVDRWEASLVERTAAGESDFSPYQTVGSHRVRAVTRPSVVPQAYISRNEAAEACAASGKRLCSEQEWRRACEGASFSRFPYGERRVTGYCNEQGRPPLAALFPDNPHSWESMNDPRLNQVPHTVAKTGAFAHCVSSYGVYDLVGNLHEWVQDPSGTFVGGYFLDTSQNGDGCSYKTVAHDAAYHDYSTGFRCCADAPPP